MSAQETPTRFRTTLVMGLAILTIAVPLMSIAQPASAAEIVPGGGPRCIVAFGSEPGAYVFVYCDGVGIE